MPFEMVVKGTWNKYTADEAKVRMGATLADHKKVKSVVFSITRKVLNGIGAPLVGGSSASIKEQTKLAVYEGTGHDEGFLLILPDPKGYTCSITTHGTNTFIMHVAIGKLKHYVFNECPMPIDDVEFTIDEKEHSVLVQCPDWLRFNTQTRRIMIEGPKVDVVDMPRRRRAG